MQVIGFAGQLAYGKDVAADYLAEKLNEISSEKGEQLWVRDGFANALKRIYQESFGVDSAFIEKWKRSPEIPPGMLMTVRKGLQFIGDGFRTIQANIWIDIALRDESRKLILSDSRYINEAIAIKEKGGHVVVLSRPDFLNNDPNPSEAQIKPIVLFCDKYLKEGKIPPFEYLKALYGDACPDEIQYYSFYIKNDGSIADLYSKIDKNLIPHF